MNYYEHTRTNYFPVKDKDTFERACDEIPGMNTHWEEGQVCVVTGVGYEGMRYVAGFALAFNSEGRQVYINTDSIYNLSDTAELGQITSRAEY